MSAKKILDKLEAEIEKPDFKNHVVYDSSSEGEVSSIWYALYDPDDFEDGEFPEPAGDKWEEALDQYIEDAWYRFENNFSKIAKIENGMLALYREITVESIPRFLY